MGPEGVGDERRPVAAADGRRCRVKAGQRVQHRHHVLDVAAPSHPDRQAETAVCIDHVEELAPQPISGCVELEVHGPDLVRVFGLRAPNRAIGRTSPLLLAWGCPLQTLLTPEAVYPLVVHQPAFPTQQAVVHAPAPAHGQDSDLAETTAQLSPLDQDDLAQMALGAAVLPNPSGALPL